jgi:hypothetical protein
MHAGRERVKVMEGARNMGRGVDINLVLSLVAAVPGGLALFGAAVGYGRLQQRLIGMDTRIDAMDEKVTKLETMSNDMARIDERTKATDDNVREVKDSLRTITDHLLSEARAFGLKAVERTTPRHRG